jgi:hypothetical protein
VCPFLRQPTSTVIDHGKTAWAEIRYLSPAATWAYAMIPAGLRCCSQTALRGVLPACRQAKGSPSVAAYLLGQARFNCNCIQLVRAVTKGRLLTVGNYTQASDAYSEIVWRPARIWLAMLKERAPHPTRQRVIMCATAGHLVISSKSPFLTRWMNAITTSYDKTRIEPSGCRE